MGAQNRVKSNGLFPFQKILADRKEQEEKKKKEQWYTDTGNRLTSMQKQLDELSAFQKQRQEFMPSRRMGATTVGQQMGGAGLRISGTGGMSPSARRRMRRAG